MAPTTLSVKEADAMRDKDIQALFSNIKAYKNSCIHEKREAYQVLNKLFQGYKDLPTANYEKETALLKNLFDKLAQPYYYQHLSQVNALEFLENLKASQAQFYQIYLEADQYEQAGNLPTATEIRKSIESDYQLFYNYLYAIYLVDQDELIKKVLLLANDIRQNFNELLHRRSSKQQSEEVSVEELPPKENLD